ncbi:MAG TPA: tRNA guanosine(34) transglycosylase Tgt [Kofleriaceae bacterium]|nr:tRNA guanosine(34) transglycosylase Tgt [Kofleriaceae bacterium]
MPEFEFSHAACHQGSNGHHASALLTQRRLAFKRWHGYNPGVLFEVLAQAPDSRARAGRLTTAHSVIETPVFMPVGTRGTVRSQNLTQLERLAPQIILANTYHLMITPGIEVFQKFGGLHPWMRWGKSILTDSGGFQIFSLSHARAMAEEGAEFRSHTDGTKFLLTPERSIAVQRAIGSDIMMVLDQCIDSTSPRAQAVAAMELTHRWAARSLAARADSPNALFAIVQGACFPDLRRISADALINLAPDAATGRHFDGFAIGGLAVGESKTEREDMCELTAALLPLDKPRYLMGVGTPLDLLEGVHRGVDMFDCVMPTSWAQQGEVFTSRGRVSLRRGVYKFSSVPLDDKCDCEACTLYTRSYLHHLVKCREPLGWHLLAFHNLQFYLRLMTEIRAQIRAGTFASYYAAKRQELGLTDQDNPPGVQPKGKHTRSDTLGNFRVHRAPANRGQDDGPTFASIAHIASGEIMHSVNDPNQEAERIYIAQSTWLRNLADSSTATAALPNPLVVWDVGLGAGHNAMALVRALQAAPGHPPVELVSFEHDLDALKLALDHLKAFPHLRHEAPHRLLHAHADGQPCELRHGIAADAAPNFTWRLLAADFAATLTTVRPPQVIFYDPFSWKTDAPMWTLAAFEQLFAALQGSPHRVEIFTYTNSTAVRTALLAAGFFVGKGVATGPKSETTIAWYVPTGAPPPPAAELLGADWLARRARSTAQYGSDLSDAAKAEVDARLLRHPQFAVPAR